MMRLLSVVLLAASVQAQIGVAPMAAGEPVKPGSVQGTVVSVTGEPLRKAEVTLRAVGQRGASGGGPRGAPMMGPGGESGGVWVHTTDPSGTFAFDQVSPGTYGLSVQRNGYVRSDGGGRGGPRGGGAPITIMPGQTVSGITIKLTPHGVITGKVTDEDGDPIGFTSVQVMRERWVQGKRQIVPMNADSTNDLGEYRIAGLMPGRYQLMVNHNRGDNAAKVRAQGAMSDMAYVSVYYPGTSEISQAAPVTLAPGQELRGIDFQLRKVPTFRVRGKVIDERGAPVQQVAVIAMPAEGGMFGGMRAMGMVRNGVFEVAGLAPGSYTLMANGAGRGQPRVFARQPVQVGTRDVDGVLLAMQPTFEVSGTIRVPEGVTLGPSRVFLDPLEAGMPFGGGGSAVVEANAWKVTNTAPGRFRFFLNPLPEGTYVKGVNAQGQEITAGAMISAAAGGIEIVLGGGAPELTGAVVDKEKETASGATVVLVPDSNREQFWLFRTATTDQNGAFALKNIAPGHYTAYAFADVEEGSWHNADFLKQYEGRGVKLKLEEKARETTALVLAQ